MVPSIASSGKSFKGAAAYYFRDKDASTGKSFKGAAAYYFQDKNAGTRERIAWVHTENLPTDDPEKAWKVMAWTAMHQATLKAVAGVRATGRKLEKPVFAFSVSWHPEQNPDKAHMLATAKAAAAVLGLSGHQAVYVAHNDEPHPHVHVLVNRVHPEHGKAATLSRSKAKLAAWALAYEKEHGKVYCQGRENNARARAEGKPERDRNPVIQAAWRLSDNGCSFQAALATRGYTLAQGNRRLVVVDAYGKVLSPVRQLPGVRTAAFKNRMADLDYTSLPTATAVQKRIKQEQRKEYAVSRKFDRWSADYLNKNLDRQIEERAALGTRYINAFNRKKDEMTKYYRIAELSKSIDSLQNRVKRPSLLRRLTGAARKDRTDLIAQRLQLEDGQRRLAEQLGAVTTECDSAVSDMAERHARENVLAREHIADRRPTFYREGRATEHEHPVRGANRSRDEEGGRERVYHHHSSRISLAI